MDHPLRLLIVDDQQPDAELSANQLARGGYPCTWRRVETEAEFRSELRRFAPDLILSDFTLPRYDGLSALELAVSEAPSIPFIFVSGTLGEKRATEALSRGAADYVSKDDLAGLVPAVTRALSHSSAPPSQEAPTERIRRLTGALQMLSSMRAAALALHTRTALVEEVCRIVDATKQYDYSFVALINPHTHVAHAVAWAGTGSERGQAARFEAAATEQEDSSVVGRVLRTSETVVCLQTEQYSGALSKDERAAAPPESGFVSLPLQIGHDTVGALTVGTSRGSHLSEPELLLLEELASQLSAALQALHEGSNVRCLPTFDTLTGLPNREFFWERLAHRLRETSHKDNTTVIVFDVTRLGDVNDAHGRHVGDRLLQRVAERLRRRFGDDADLAYFGGGMFAAVFSDRRARPESAHDPTTATFGQPFAIGDHCVPVTIKCGLARYPTHGGDAETLLQHAEAALGRLRERSESDPESDVNPLDTRERVLEQRLRLALQHNEFRLHYQPVIERVSGQVVAVEALLRWRDPERGIVPPSAFLSTLERTHLALPVGEWVLEQAVHDFERWHTIGLPTLRVAVNVSAAELERKDFAAYFLSNTRHAHHPPYVDIEIAEGALVENPERLRQTLKELRGEGVRVAIDDFGMSRTALARLCELPVDSLKIDRSFISHLTSQPQSQAVVSAIIALARTYGLRTVAEGVENIEQLKILDALGCEQSQGYLHSPAVPAEELELLVATRSTAAGS